MKKVFLLTVLFSVMAFVSCNKEEDIDFSSEIVGTWRYDLSDVIIETNNDAASAAIKKALEYQGQDVRFTADKKYFEESTEAGTYEVSGNKLTIQRTDGETHHMELSKPDQMLYIIEDLTENFQSDALSFDNLEIYTLKVTSKYSKVQ